MTPEDQTLERAVVAAINARMGAKRISIAELARMMDRPYDSTRNYLVGERSMPLDFLLAAADALGVPADTIVREGREQFFESNA